MRPFRPPETEYVRFARVPLDGVPGPAGPVLCAGAPPPPAPPPPAPVPVPRPLRRAARERRAHQPGPAGPRPLSHGPAGRAARGHDGAGRARVRGDAAAPAAHVGGGTL